MVVIDSVIILAIQYADKFYMRQGLQGMVQALENFGVTSLILSEYSENDEIPLECFITSGIIQLRHTQFCFLIHLNVTGYIKNHSKQGSICA